MNLLGLKLYKQEHKYRKSQKLLNICEKKFKTFADFENFITTKEKLPDSMAIYDIPFTMEEYDMSGETVIYKNKKLMLDIIVEHFNRYANMANIKNITMEEGFSFREDISYIQ